MPRVVHFEISVDDPERAMQFYGAAFSWQIGKWGPADYWLIKTGDEGEPGIDGALRKRQANEGTTNTISVPAIDEFMEKVTAHGGEVLGAKMAIPGVGYHVYCKDTEGNVFGMMEEDETAQ